MALKDRILSDNHKIFMNKDHYGEDHTWNGVPFVTVPDDEVRLKRKNNNVNDISWDGNTLDKVIFVPEDSLPARAQANESVILDGVQMRVIDVIDAVGMKEIHLTLHYTKAVRV